MLHFYAFIFTILLHVTIIFYNMPEYTETITPEIKRKIVPIRVSFYQEPTPLILTSTSPVTKTVVPIKKPPKLTRLPGDRSHPVIETSRSPTYPKYSLNHNLQGKIIVQATVNVMGRITKILILQSSGHPSLDESFLYTIKHHYFFKPKRVMGKNRVSVIKLSHEFRI